MDLHPSDTRHASPSEPRPGTTLRALDATVASPPPLDTTVSMTVTPASTTTDSAVSTSSSNASALLDRLPTLTSPPVATQDTCPPEAVPSALLPNYPSPTPSLLVRSSASGHAASERSPSPHTRGAPPSAMAEAMAGGRNQGLIRRLSRGAHNRLRRRASTSQSMRMRDQSAGPVLMRRRSDSNGNSDFAAVDRSDLDSDCPPDVPDEVLEEMHYPAPHDAHTGLGIALGRPSNASSALGRFEGGIAPAISAVLEQGTWVTKVTTKRTKRIKIWLDPDAARVCWHPTTTAKSFFIDDVREIRVGADSRNARDDVHIPDEQETRWITIVYDCPDRSKGSTIKTMHLMTPDAYITSLWADALNKVTRERIEIMNALSSSLDKSERSMALAWRQAMTRKGPGADEFFTLDDARWLCRKLEINCSDSTVRTHFTRSDTSLSGLLDYARYQDFVRSFKERKDIQNLYRNIQYGTDLDMNLVSFFDFLRVEQNADVEHDRTYWEGVFDKFARLVPVGPTRTLDADPSTETQRTINMQGFRNFLTSSFNTPLIPARGEVVLDRPLNEYFVSSSHNTYLLGRQVAGASSVEGYISALVKGCRCVEIDCWDGDDGRPMVTHGRTMTTKVPFADCVSVIAKYAFHTSPYPLIVSLEVHCNSEQQLAMVDLMKKHWDSTMLTEPLFNNATTLPSPDDLRHKILVKVKAAEETDLHQVLTEVSNGRHRARSLGSSFVRTPSTDHSSVTSSPLLSSPTCTTVSASDHTVGSSSTPRGSTTSGPTLTPSSSGDDSEPAPVSSDNRKKRKTSKIEPRLGKLGVYTQGIKYTGFTPPEAKAYNHVYSLAEDKFARLCTKQTDTKALLERHNMRYLMRVYPAARRIDSSNFNPLQAWRRGVQMAALNWQTHDVHLQVNEAMFAAGSDRVGYVLKPPELRNARHDVPADAPDGIPKKGKKLVKFSVDIISAQRLPRPRNQNIESGMNPYIEFEMYSAEDKARGIARGEGGTDASARDGMSGIGLPLRKRTRVMEGNGFDPVYNQPVTMTVETKYPSLIFVRWTVWHSPDGRGSSSNNVLLATFTAKLDSLQQGYRHLPLFNPNGEQYRDAKLFVKIRKDPAVAIDHDGDAQSILEPAAVSPRLDPVRGERSWPRRIFSRNSSERRRRDPGPTSDLNGVISRTSSMER